MSNNPTQRKIDNLRAVADFMARHSDILDELSYEVQYGDSDIAYEEQTYVSVSPSTWGKSIDLYVQGPDSVTFMAKLRRYFGGQWDKSTTSYSFSLKRTVDDVRVEISSQRDSVCRKVVTGTKTVVKPAMEARPEETVEEEEFEWVCSPLLEEEAASESV